MSTRIAVALWGTLVLAGCAGLPAAAPEPRPVLALPDRWQATLPHGGTLAELGRWWSQFDDPLLERVFGAAQSASPTIASAASRIEQARSTRTAAGAALLPALEELVGHESLMLYDTLGPTLTQTAAGIAAQAAGHAERARDHFEHALATAGRLRSPLLGPPAKLWYGRHLCAPDRDADSRAKGAALLAEALEEFRGLGMPIHMQYAERWLSEPSAA